MKNFKDYEDLIKDEVHKVNEKDVNWDWKVVSIEDNLVKISWGYLDYLEEKDNCFFLKLNVDMGDVWVASRDPQDEMIDGYFVSENPEESWEVSYESGIKSCIDSIYYLAHNNY